MLRFFGDARIAVIFSNFMRGSKVQIRLGNASLSFPVNIPPGRYYPLRTGLLIGWGILWHIYMQLAGIS
ncbi:hypothetical protein I7I53_03792 [Histoplasma capsulatum var. duboisii H88]|uniref:Uncharacterized protein n=1 Tax=Ajellomyces capsulatus (strain H88) TaxID=544711 RepID=A0A8A1LV35_AJEC8|nr:hypothetical protein I7I53_03792 [Histoplasma capsulatum var. duboisii H88]